MSTRQLKRNLKYLIPEFKLALIREGKQEPLQIQCPQDVDRFIEPLKHASEEKFLALHMSSQHTVIGFHVVSHGTLTSSLVHPREVFKAALLSNANCLIVAHNHPGGSLVPSSEDIETTEKLVAVGKMIGVPVIDHIIVAAKGITSLRENHPELF